MTIERITKKALLETLAAENLNKVGTFTDAKEPIREPGTIGIAKTEAGNYMAYCVNENGKLYKTSVHKNRREANGMVLRRFHEILKEQKEPVMADMQELDIHEKVRTDSLFADPALFGGMMVPNVAGLTQPMPA